MGRSIGNTSYKVPSLYLLWHNVYVSKTMGLNFTLMPTSFKEQCPIYEKKIKTMLKKPQKQTCCFSQNTGLYLAYKLIKHHSWAYFCVTWLVFKVTFFSLDKDTPCTTTTHMKQHYSRYTHIVYQINEIHVYSPQ